MRALSVFKIEIQEAEKKSSHSGATKLGFARVAQGVDFALEGLL